MNLITNNDTLLTQMISNQRSDVESSKKLKICDMARISKNVSESIFDPDKCCIWEGYITNENNNRKGTYVNFYFKGKKAALHRLLYANFVENIDNKNYIRFTCDNKGKCCNVNHMTKYAYKKTNNSRVTKNISIPPRMPPDENMFKLTI